MKFCIDTSGLIDAWVRSYPPDIFGSFWEKLDQLISENKLIAPDEVLIELDRKADDLCKWAKKRRNMFVPLKKEIQMASIEILAQFPHLIDTRKNRNGADPFVIGLARVEKCIVVSGEKNSGTDQKPKIPNV